MKSFLLCTGLLGAAFSGRAQAVVSTGQLLATARDAPAYSAYQDELRFLQTTDFSLPLLNKTEFRTGNNGFALSGMEYALRFSPYGRAEARAEGALHQARIRIREAASAGALADCLSQRYRLAAEMAFTAWIRQAKENLLAVLEEQQRLRLTALNAGQNADVAGLAESEADMLKLKLELIEMEGREAALQQSLAGFMRQGASGIDTAGWISVGQIKALISAVSAVPASANPALQQERLKQEWAGHNYLKQKAQNRRLLDFFQTEYNGNRGNRFDEVFSLRLGLNLPFAGDGRLDVNKALLEQRESELEYNVLKYELEWETCQLADELGTLISQCEYLDSLKKEALSVRLLSNPALLQQLPPLEVSKLKEEALKRQILHLELLQKVAAAWIGLLEVSGKLVEMPLRNYLSEGLEPF